MVRDIAPPPASNPQGAHDPRNVRHSCGFAYNGYVWSSCPQCEADNRGVYALRCKDCRNPFFAAERVDHCPECESGNTAVLATPESATVR